MGTWTRNYTNILASFFAGPNATTNLQSGSASYTNDNLTVRIATGGYYKIYNDNKRPGASNAPSCAPRMAGTFYLFNSNSSSNLDKEALYIALGNGADQDGYEAYALNGLITSGFGLGTSQPTPVITYDSVAHKYIKTLSIGVQNTSNNNVSISEVGLLTSVTSSSSNYGALIYYDHFDTITLEPYESVVITITQSFPLVNYQPYPTA